jgi:hypothetical protein
MREAPPFAPGLIVEAERRPLVDVPVRGHRQRPPTRMQQNPSAERCRQPPRHLPDDPDCDDRRASRNPALQRDRASHDVGGMFLELGSMGSVKKPPTAGKWIVTPWSSIVRRHPIHGAPPR